MQIPADSKLKKLIQLNNSNVLGDLWATYGLDLTENEGVVRLGKRLVLNTNTSDVAEMTSYPAAFRIFMGSKYAIAGASAVGYAFSQGTTYPSATLFSKVTGSNTPTKVDSIYSDMEVLDSVLYVSQNDTTVSYTTDGSTWGSMSTVGNSGSVHLMTAYASRMYMTNLFCKILSWNTSRTVVDTGQFTLDLGNSAANVITFLRSSSNRIWIGTVNTTGGKGYIYEWDGSTTQVQKAYRLESTGALSCVIKDDVPYVVDTNGSLLVWNGGTFKKLTQFNRRNNQLLSNATSSQNNRFIHPNGMSLINGKINILINGRNYNSSVNQEETISSGVWEYDEAKGLYHKYAFGSSRAAGTIVDYGQSYLSGVGALSELNPSSNAGGRNGTFLAGSTYYTDATNTSSGIFFDDSNDTERKGGWLISTKLRPESSKLGPTISSIWKKFYLSHRKLLNAADRIVVKYRSTEQEPTTMTITWASTTSFTTTDTNMANYAVGDEVEVVQAIGGGICSHITAIVNNAGTYTVTVDETHTSATGTAKARFQKWIKMLEVNDQTSTWNQAGFPASGGMPLASTWIQLKVWMVFTGQDELEILTVVDTPSQIAQSQ